MQSLQSKSKILTQKMRKESGRDRTPFFVIYTNEFAKSISNGYSNKRVVRREYFLTNCTGGVPDSTGQARG